MEKKRPIPEVISPELIYDLGFKLTRERDRVLYYMLWISMSRISECLNARPKDLYFTTEEGKTFYNLNLINLKNRVRTSKRVPVRYDLEKDPDISDEEWGRHLRLRQIDRKMISIILDFIENENIGEDDRIFPKVLNGKGLDITRHNYYNRLKYNLRTTCRMIVHTPEGRKTIDNADFRLNPHYLRHARITWLYITKKKLKEQHMVLMAGWSDARPMKNYAHLKIGDLLEVL